MKIKTTGAIVNGKAIGSVLDLTQKDSKRLIAEGVAEKVVEKKESAPKKTTPQKKAETKPQPVKDEPESKDKQKEEK